MEKRRRKPIRSLRMQKKRINRIDLKLKELIQEAKDLAWLANMLFNALHNRSADHGNGE